VQTALVRVSAEHQAESDKRRRRCNILLQELVDACNGSLSDYSYDLLDDGTDGTDGEDVEPST
jgi:hypothetical protein